MAKRQVKEMWWEGADLHIIYADDSHEIFQQAVITSYDTEEVPGLEITPVELEYGRL